MYLVNKSSNVHILCMYTYGRRVPKRIFIYATGKYGYIVQTFRY